MSISELYPDYDARKDKKKALDPQTTLIGVLAVLAIILVGPVLIAAMFLIPRLH